MARYERFESGFKCPECGIKGVATWEEYENPVHAGGVLTSRLKSVSVGFSLGKQNAKRREYEILCDNCNGSFVIKERN